MIVRHGMNFSSADQSESIKSNYGVKLLDIKLYKTFDGIILIGFDLISTSHDPSNLPLSLGKMTDQWSEDMNILSQVLNDADEETRTFLRSEVMQTLVHDEISPFPYVKSSIVYELPTHPDAALNWLGCFVQYLNSMLSSFCTNYIASIHFTHYLSDRSFEEFKNGKVDIHSMSEYANMNNDNRDVHLTLMQAIISLKTDDKQDSYYNAIRAIERIHFAYLEYGQQKLFVELLGKNRLAITSDLQLKIYSLNDLIVFSRKFLENNQPILLTKFLQSHDHLTRQILFSQAIGKTAYDGGEYNWKYTEWDFFKPADLAMTPGGDFSIEVEKNPGYQRWYAPGKRYHAIFKDEMIFLANILGLKFDEGCDFHKKLVFTAESTLKLQSLGFIPVEYIQEAKKNMRKQNFLSLFNPKRTQVADENKPSSVLSLHTEILELIHEEAIRSPRP